ncbi:Putative metal-dependent hydrolase yfiT [Chlamydia abortus]|uniref:DinB family protein n=1 Tax=Paenibacillus sp. SAFN-117 TaxID=3436860 RepID=UPI000A27AF0F|nr:Putative metal-dependent hydrolase yfiT [Chlamydia abortus]
MKEEDFKVIQTYREAARILMEVLDGLGDRELDLSRGEGKWTIREIVHHIVECDLNYFQINRYALANTGEKYFFNEFDAHVWNQSMNHNQRDIRIEVQLFSTIREYISYLCEIIPNSLDRILVHQNGTATVRDALNHDINHSYHHIEQIKETRRIHSI